MALREKFKVMEGVLIQKINKSVKAFVERNSSW
jgi:hypothetical protein